MSAATHPLRGALALTARLTAAALTPIAAGLLITAAWIPRGPIR